MRGHLWGGLFATDAAPPVPPDLAPLTARSLAVFVIRYREGTLRYDELIVGSPARRGRRAGLYVHRIWVDDERSLRGGRRIWGVPKELAEFRWEGPRVRVTDGQGLVAALRLSAKGPSLPRLPLPMTGFGTLDGARTVLTARFTARPGAASVRVEEWPARLPALHHAGARPGFSAASFTMLLPVPTFHPLRPAPPTG
ncbi:acetoacetate decarboxylase family protein [Streptomyces paromomycinus]|uniref:Acetoacetate decarboxylase n=1 Tax=Streptomyces paromomycinus TaxID=92743 RepID=A0A401WFD1_STREY|nr:acetoacetate decarboxylase family protein [Streptomyces paromomycinus]GCD48000.1 acetoacetate decarboxylase [Streptomyces paromomycinus]